MNPESIIADLDASLLRTGEKVTVRRYTASSGTPRPKTDIDNVPAAVRAVKPEEMVGDIKATHSRVVLSPSGLASLLPLKKDDKIVIQGRERNIDHPGPIFLQGVLVRMNLMVAG
jgi:hypothetical protein